MALTIVTFEQLGNIQSGNPLTFNAQVILFEEGTWSVYRLSDSEESDPDPIFETESITKLYEYLNK